MLDGDEWVIDGQKIWTSAGHVANWIFVLARTNPDAPKHKGISFLLVPMDQPGVEVRPIRMITGEAEFNEVFFTDARCPAANVVGDVNAGWGVAMTLLGYERGEAAATFPIMFRTELDRLLALAEAVGPRPPTRWSASAWPGAGRRCEVMRYLGMRTLTRYLAGGHPGPDASIFKLYWSEYHKVVTELAVDVLGADALVPQRPVAVQLVPGRRRRRTQRQRVVGGHLLRGAGRDDLRRHLPGAAQHPRRDGAGSAQGAGGAEGHLASAPTTRRVRATDRTAPRSDGRLRGAGGRRRPGPAPRAVAHRGAPGAGAGPPGLVADLAVPALARSRLPAVPPPDRLRRPDRRPEPADLVTYLHWCRAWPRVTR